MRFFGILAQQSADSGIADPTDYGSDLRTWLDSELLVTLSGNDVLSWGDSDPNNATTVFDPPAGGSSPAFVANDQNGFPGIDFRENPPSNGSITRKITANASQLDNWFVKTSGFQTIAFAARWDVAVDSRFNTASTIIEKGYRDEVGWQIRITPDGTIRLEQRRANASTWSMRVPGFYDVGDLVLGYAAYNGGNATNSGFFRLYDKVSDDFLTLGTITLGTSSTIADDAAHVCCIGNQFDENDPDQNAPFEGPIFSLWAVENGKNFGDEEYLRRYIV